MKTDKIIAMPDLFRHPWTPQQVRGGIFVAVIALMFLGSLAYAGAPATSSAQPVTISAVKSLEWDRNAKTYTARQDAIATQGTSSIHSDLLTAHYTEDNGSSPDITTMDADGHVTIAAPPYTAYGDHGVYDVKTGNAVLTGKDLKIVSTDSTLTARDKIIFNSAENKMTAVGDPRAVKGDNVLTADNMSAVFTKDSTGKMAANKILAKGHVTITTPTQSATGDDGVYDVPTQKAVLTGKVTIFQDKNWLQGTRADVDMATGISRLSGGNAGNEGRVTGTFYPQKKPEAPKPQVQPPANRDTQDVEAPSTPINSQSMPRGPLNQ
jgi:lipopolysaccharide export system protein LptA